MLAFTSSHLGTIFSCFFFFLPPGKRFLRPPHIVILGEHSLSDFAAFVCAFYAHPANAYSRIVLLSRELVWTDEEQALVRLSQIGPLVRFVRGIPMVYQDRERVAVSLSTRISLCIAIQPQTQTSSGATSSFRTPEIMTGTSQTEFPFVFATSVQIRDAEACIIMSNRYAKNVPREDSLNILRSINVRGHSPQVSRSTQEEGV